MLSNRGMMTDKEGSGAVRRQGGVNMHEIYLLQDTSTAHRLLLWASCM
jgi:hypothetical protein